MAAKHLEDLISASFLEIRGLKIKVHELLLDVAQYASGNEFYSQGIPQADGKWQLPTGARHLCICEKYDTFRWPSMSEADSADVSYSHVKSLRLLYETEIPYSGDFLHAFKFKYLRALHIHGCIINTLPKSLYRLYNLRQLIFECRFDRSLQVSDLIGNLKNLQHLVLSCIYIQEMPEAMLKLTALHELSLRGCRELKELPSGITKLINLRSLDLRGTSIRGMPSGISMLRKLEIIPHFPLDFKEEHAQLREISRDARALQTLEHPLKLEEQSIDELMKTAAMYRGRELDSLANLKARIAGSGLEGMDGLLEDLEYVNRAWKYIKATIANAERQPIQNKSVQHWLCNLRDLSWEVEDLVDLYEYQVMAMQAEKKEKEVGWKLNPDCKRDSVHAVHVPHTFASPILGDSFVKKAPHGRFNDIFQHNKVSLPEPITSPSLIKKILDGARKIRERFDEIAIREKQDMYWWQTNMEQPSEEEEEEDEIVGSSMDRPTGSTPNLRYTLVGRDEQEEEMLDMLFAGGDKYTIEVIALVGMGGIGKSTLCHRIYNDSKIKSHFDVRLWVHIGKSFDVRLVRSKILCSIMEEFDDYHFILCPEQARQLVMEIMAKVRGKRLLLVMEDVWCQNMGDWQTALAPLMVSGVKRGSKILVTTRMPLVAWAAGASNCIQLCCLSEKDGWLLFRRYANIGTGHSPELLDVGKAILAKCEGLPLAIKLMASLLRHRRVDVHHWRHILDSDFSNINEDGKKIILGPLYVCYLHLPSLLKACFPFFNFLRKPDMYTTAVDAQKLIDLWVAHNLIGDEGETSLKEKGSKVIDDFESRSFLERDCTDPTMIKVHDLVLDLAKYISGTEFCIMHRRSDKNEPRILSTDIRHLSTSEAVPKKMFHDGTIALRTLELISFQEIYNLFFQETYNYLRNLIQDAESLRFLRIYNLDMGNLDIHFHFKHLRVLSIEETNMRVVPESLYTSYNLIKLDIVRCFRLRGLSDCIGNLKKLRCLHVRECQRIQKIPESISELTALEELDLNGCRDIKWLPAGIARLNNLCYLNVDGTAIHHMPFELLNLRKLRHLPYCPLGWGDVHDLKNDLNNLNLEGESLSIAVHGGLRSGEESKEAETQIKGRFHNMNISFYSMMNVLDHEKLLQYLKPHSSIRILELNGYRGARLPLWMGDGSFNQLVKIVFVSMECETLSPVQKLPSLRELIIKWAPSLKKVVSEEDLALSLGPGANTLKLLNQTHYFPKLESLEIDSCHLIEVFPIYVFPVLQRISICRCKNLKSFEFVDPSMIDHWDRGDPSLNCLSLEKCPQLSFSSTTVPPLSLKEVRILGSCDELQSWCRSTENSKWTDIIIWV